MLSFIIGWLLIGVASVISLKHYNYVFTEDEGFKNWKSCIRTYGNLFTVIILILLGGITLIFIIVLYAIYFKSNFLTIINTKLPWIKE